MLLQTVLSELQREHNMRKYVFPKLQREGRLTPTEGVHRQACLEAGMRLIASLIDRGCSNVDSALILVMECQLPIHIKGAGQVQQTSNQHTDRNLA